MAFMRDARVARLPTRARVLVILCDEATRTQSLRRHCRCVRRSPDSRQRKNRATPADSAPFQPYHVRNGRCQLPDVPAAAQQENSMNSHTHVEPTVVVIFGGGGDLTHRKLVPALYNLFLDRWLPGNFAILGIDRLDDNDDAYRQQMRASVDQFSRRGKTKDD